MKSVLNAACVFVLAAACLSIAGCSGVNVRPGDVDYPQTNANAGRALEIHGRIDSDIDGDSDTPIRFAAFWVTTKGRDWPVADGNCNYMFNRFEGVSDAYDLIVPLAPVMQAKGSGNYTVQVATDAFLPGRCGWRFSGVLIYTDGEVFDSGFTIDSAEVVVRYAPSLQRWGARDMIESKGDRLDIACKRMTYGVSQAPHEGIFLRCVDRTSGKKVRLLLPESGTPSLEINIHRGS